MKFGELDKKLRIYETAHDKCALRRKLKVDLELPMRDEYDRFILKIIESNENNRD